MDIVVIALVSFGASILTFFSGIGLGTLLLPVFALFFPIEISVALTGIVHLLNNLFKMILVGKGTHWKTVVRFGVPAILMAFVGAWILVRFSSDNVLFFYHIGTRLCEVTSVKLLIAFLMFIFSFLELFPVKNSFKITEKHLPLGGALSGFFGGLSGHQGALRSALLLKAGLGKEAYVATGVFLAAVVDISRISVYMNK